MDEQEAVAAMIADYRRRRGLTLERLGDLLGVRFETIWRWEHKRRTPPGRLVQLALGGLDKEQGWSDTSLVDDRPAP
jgi:transcriptional regulator with XRE-family HTH domain